MCVCVIVIVCVCVCVCVCAFVCMMARRTIFAQSHSIVFYFGPQVRAVLASLAEEAADETGGNGGSGRPGRPTLLDQPREESQTTRRHLEADANFVRRVLLLEPEQDDAT